MLLYYAIFAPFLTYGVSVWGLSYPSMLDYISAPQEKILRIVTFSDKKLHHHLFLIVCKFSDILILYIVSFVFECVHSLAPTYFRNYFTSIQSIHNIGRRQSQKGDLSALYCNTTQYRLCSINFTGVWLWNSLPCEIRESPSLPVFRKKNQNPDILENYKS